VAASAWLPALLLARVVTFDVDWAVFRGAGESCRVEFAYGIPYEQLSYRGTDAPEASFTVSLDMCGVETGFREQGSIRKRAGIGSFREAEEARRTLVDEFSVLAPPGRYAVAVAVADSSGRGVVTDTLEVPAFTDRPAMSTLQLGAEVVADTADGSFAVVPNPGRRFSPGALDRLYFYLEVYNLAQDSRPCQVNCWVVRREGRLDDTVVRAPPVFRSKTGTGASAALGVSIDGLQPGRYELLVSAGDSAGDRAAVRGAEFTVSPARTRADATPYRLELTESSRRHYRELQYVATPTELSYYGALSDSGKESYLAWFWQRHDLAEFSRRMDVAEARYARANAAGVRTDRGRVYVTYGEPDAVEQRVMDVEARPREYWHYYQLGHVFIFVDIRGDGNYRLVYSNSPSEQPTGLGQYLTPDEQQQYR